MLVGAVIPISLPLRLRNLETSSEKSKANSLENGVGRYPGHPGVSS
jgi:hypothetical protein